MFGKEAKVALDTAWQKSIVLETLSGVENC